MNSGEIHHSMDDMFVFTERVLQAEPTATFPKPNLGEIPRRVIDQRLTLTIYQDKRPVGGDHNQ